MDRTPTKNGGRAVIALVAVVVLVMVANAVTVRSTSTRIWLVIAVDVFAVFLFLVNKRRQK
ncbi:hypothetical protein [Arsenicicoccus sp. UBA7492]|uniref:hypothetical protein n=1 Tax=Arsenicicoccus sp. UBA7492 TaxID=1946057 RepID=UPI0025800701|nr:hypothetical protein [Arsenicicoccus sp. UBA7492]